MMFLMAVVRPKTLQPSWIPLSLLTSNISPKPISSTFKELLNPTSSHHPYSVLAPPSQHSPTPLYSQHSSSREPVQMVVYPVSYENCPLALHLTQHESLSPFYLTWSDTVLLSYSTPLDLPHSGYADLPAIIPTQQAPSNWGPIASSLSGRLFPQRATWPFPSSPSDICWNVTFLLRPPWYHTLLLPCLLYHFIFLYL